jgi:hypothetical protein
MTFGPFAPGLDPAERQARIRALRALAGVFCHRFPSFGEALLRAETEPTALNEALQLLDQLPALNRRRLLASYSNLSRVVAR